MSMPTTYTRPTPAARLIFGPAGSAGPARASRAGSADQVRHGYLEGLRRRFKELVAELVVDGDHVLVDGGVPGDDALQLRLGLRQPVEHRGLDQQPEPVPAVLADH